MVVKLALSLILREEHILRLSENRLLRRIFGPNRVEVAGDWRSLHNEKLHNLYASPHIIRVIKLTKMMWVELLVRMAEMEMDTKFWSENLNGK
jgi:hypothetical protein